MRLYLNILYSWGFLSLIYDTLFNISILGNFRLAPLHQDNVDLCVFQINSLTPLLTYLLTYLLTELSPSWGAVNCDKEKNDELEPRFLGLPSHTLFNTLIELLWLLMLVYAHRIAYWCQFLGNQAAVKTVTDGSVHLWEILKSPS
jgi:hypothetical protein